MTHIRNKSLGSYILACDSKIAPIEGEDGIIRLKRSEENRSSAEGQGLSPERQITRKSRDDDTHNETDTEHPSLSQARVSPTQKLLAIDRCSERVLRVLESVPVLVSLLIPCVERPTLNLSRLKGLAYRKSWESGVPVQVSSLSLDCGWSRDILRLLEILPPMSLNSGQSIA
ncbi:hypothetical protein TNCV_4768621 [Trichonephila clavipes]|nr:hypothetical protein TNCV_4768621 [Trichonephila clavipes]